MSRKPRTENARLWGLLMGCALSACAATPHLQTQGLVLPKAPSCEQNERIVVSQVSTQPSASPNALGHALLSVVTDTKPVELLLYDLDDQRLLWRKPLDVRARPQVLHDVVVTRTADTWLGLDLKTGEARFSVPMPEGMWLGATQLGMLVVLTTTKPTLDPRTRQSTLSAVDLANGRLRWQRTLPLLLSAPVSGGSQVLSIADHRQVRAFSAADGGDAGCFAPQPPQLLDWLRLSDHGLFYGADRAQRALAGTTTAALFLPKLDIPSHFDIEASDHDAVPAERSAHGRVGWEVALRANAAGLPTASADRLYFVFYRHVLAYRSDGSLAWARSMTDNVVRADASDAGLSIVTESGEVASFEANAGAEVGRSTLGVRAASAAFNLSALKATTAQPAPQLRASLRELALDPDTRLLPSRALAIDGLAALPDPEASRDLLEVVSAAHAPEALRKRVSQRLMTRTLGVDQLITALATRYDFLTDHGAPPLDVILPALIAQHQTRALPYVVDALFDPSTEASQLALCVSAIDALGDAEQAREPLERFLALYHADSSLEADPSALILAAKALHARTQSHPKFLADLRESHTLVPLRNTLDALLAAPPKRADATGSPAMQVESTAPKPVVTETAQHAFAARAQELRACLQAELQRNPKLREVRLSFVALEDGQLNDLHVLPSSEALLTCIQPIVQQVRVAPRATRTLQSYVIGLRTPEASPPTAASPAPTEFWALSESQSTALPFIPSVDPWWKNRNPLFISIEPVATEPRKAMAEQPTSAPVPQTSAPTTPTAVPAVPASKPAPKPTPKAAPKVDPNDAWWLPAK